MVLKDDQKTDDLGIQMVKILSSDHFMFAFFNEKTKQFFSAGGGTYSYADGIYTEHIQFHTIDPDLIGASLSFKCTLKDGRWYHTGAIDDSEMNEVFEPIESDDRSLLIGAWIMNSYKDAEGHMVQPRRQDTKKIKILANNWFQWAHFNTKEGFFLETGGGRYTYKDGVYHEEIIFFSGDSTLIGKTQRFVAILKEGEWHHQEVSNTLGFQMSEVWERMDM